MALTSGIIPQITAVFGNCGGGLSVIPALSDFTFMEESKAQLFVNSPNAISGNRKELCDTANAKFQSEEAGLVDFVGSEEEIIAQMRALVDIIPSNYEDIDILDCEDDLNRACSGIENCVEDTTIAVSMIADQHNVIEVKKAYAPEMLTAFIRLNGATVGVVANRTKMYDEDMNVVGEFEDKLTAKGCSKAADFVTFCDAFDIPVLTLTNTSGFAASANIEKNLAQATAKLIYSYATATVPKVNVVIGKAYGSAYITMGCKAVETDVVYAWPTAQIGMMDSTNAVKIIYADEIAQSDDALATINEKVEQYNNIQSSVEAAASRGYVDTIIAPVDTRKYVIGAFEMLYTKREELPDKKHGTV